MPRFEFALGHILLSLSPLSCLDYCPVQKEKTKKENMPSEFKKKTHTLATHMHVSQNTHKFNPLR